MVLKKSFLTEHFVKQMFVVWKLYCITTSGIQNASIRKYHKCYVYNKTVSNYNLFKSSKMDVLL